MQLTRGERRENRRRKERYGMKVRGRSIQTLQRVIGDKAKKAREATAQ